MSADSSTPDDATPDDATPDDAAPDDALAELLGAGEQATFHGRPGDAVGPLERAVLLAREQDRTAEACAAGWLLGVALVAAGRCGSAALVFEPLVTAGRGPGADAARRLFGALASAGLAAAHRQLGRHAAARTADLEALELAGDEAEARADALLGLAADAVGLDDASTARDRLDEAAALLGADEGPDPWWRHRVRLACTDAELAMLQGDPVRAVALARGAAVAARRSGASRFAAEALLVQGIAEVDTDDGDPVATLTEAAALAEQTGAGPLVWPIRALLGALLLGSAPAESARSLAVARAAVLELAADLAPQPRAEWLARPEVAALLER